MLQLTRPTLDVGVVPVDVEAMTSFYADVLGLRAAWQMPTADGGSVQAFATGAGVIKLNAPANRPDTHLGGGVQDAIGIRLIALVVDDLDAILDRVEQARGRRPKTMGGGGFNVAFVADPDGNVLELVQTPNPPSNSARMQIGLTVADPARTTAFYAGLLGGTEGPLTAVPNLGTKHEVRLGDATVKFWAPKADTETPVRTGPIAAHAGLRYITAAVDDVDAAIDRLRDADVPVVVEPTDLGTIARVALVADPDGNWFELVTAR